MAAVPKHERSTTDAWQFFIDRGGTFTDVVARAPDGTLRTAKLLSHHPELYPDAAVAGIQRLLAEAAGSPEHDVPIGVVKIGTTVATNALLERRGEATALVTTRGFGDQLRIGYQNRPRLFDTNIRLPEALYSTVIEAHERVTVEGECLVPLDEAMLFEALCQAFGSGIRAVAIVFMHAWRYPAHELAAAELARRVGFTQVSVSHQVSPLIKFVPRGDTTVADAYLSPVVRRYVEQLTQGLTARGACPPLYFMKSSGELTTARTFQGKDAMMSGPAGGIVAMVATALRAGFQKLVGFDMGGTSTDVSHFSGSSLADCERQFESSLAGLRLRVPHLSIHTIAAGGGSIVRFDGERLRVGPESAGAVPGPACYRRGGPLTIADCNVLLGKLPPSFFPRVFGPAGDQPIDAEVVRAAFEALAARVTAATGRATSAEAVAEGCLQVAITNMANALKVVSVQRGHDLRSYTLISFGGAGGQHACAVAQELGIPRILVHPMAGVLSALGMGLSHVGNLRRVTLELPLAATSTSALERAAAELTAELRAELRAQGIDVRNAEVRSRAYLKFTGTDSTLAVPLAEIEAMRTAFHAGYLTRFRLDASSRPIVVDSIAVEIVDNSPTAELQLSTPERNPALPITTVPMYSAGAWVPTPIYSRPTLSVAQCIHGPAIITEPDTTTVVDAGWQATVTEELNLLLEPSPRETQGAPVTEQVQTAAPRDPALLEVFNGLLMSIAEQMGVQLANTAASINIKERLDFSCAIFDESGNLVANAPHVPVHLGSMGETVHAVIQNNPELRPGDVFLVNDPYNGGTHLPDITAVMPVFGDVESASTTGSKRTRPWFYVAARGHHADVGGIAPGSMPPGSKSVTEEGVLIDNFKCVDAGRFCETELLELLASGPYPARNPEQNLADVRAQIVACETGRRELLETVQRYGLPTVQKYLQYIQDNAEESVRRVLATLRGGSFSSELDCGAVVRVAITVDRDARSAVIDFSGTSPELDNNYNAPPAVVHAAVLYVFRTLVADDIPLNAGCFKPLTVLLPDGCMLSPRPPAATVAGNVETSQCVVDALYGALGGLAASQGTMNNLTFGTDRFQYYETIAGGSGAGPGFDGASAVQTHMTNSRITDPEVLELRFPVLVEEHSIRRGSGGNGANRGGDGALRRIRAREAMSASILANRRTTAPYGVAGGEPGDVGATFVERADGTRDVLSYSQQVDLREGDTITVASPAGGGYGAAIPSEGY
jgi:5-oxoprolinase (ATP-hydrolysing)